ncbi:F-box domain-containing protein [Mycena kentingensis (nom. inval.)]|nr:F-box domain-containing protein [Mycena kentingensis (nom. inval.)]
MAKTTSNDQLKQDDTPLHEERLERISSYKCPILSLPTEITREIFLQTVPTGDEFPSLYTSDVPQSLLSVCSIWRAIALSTPILWCAVDMDAAEIRLSAAQQSRTLQTWLDRSGTLPVSIRRPPFISMALVYRARWEHLDLVVDENEAALLSGRTPLLRQLFLVGFSVEGLRLQEAPLLRTVVLRGIVVSPKTLPWDALTHLALLFRPLAECAVVLREAQNLICCRLKITDGLEAPSAQIRIPSLATLVLQSTSSVDLFGGVMDFLTLPALQRIYMDPVDNLSDIVLDCLREFSNRSSCKLKILLLKHYCPLAVEEALPLVFPGIRVGRSKEILGKSHDLSWTLDDWWEAP